MTTLKTIATTCLAVSGLAMAQGTATPAPVAPRTGLYGSVTKGNIAADNTVDDYTKRPTLIGDRQYIAGFGNTDMGNAAFSLKGMGFNWFGSVTGPVNAAPAAPGTPDVLRLGLGRGTAWGAGVALAIDRQTQEVTGAAGGKQTTYIDPSGIGLFGDLSLGTSDVYGAVGWNTGYPSSLLAGAHNTTILEPNTGSNSDNTHHTLSVMAGWKKDATTEGTHSFNVEASYALGMHTTSGPGVKADDKVNALAIMPAWAYVVKANSDYSVFVGVNSLDSVVADTVPGLNGSRYLISFSPNIAFQKQFGHGFEGFSGASVTAGFMGTNDEAGANTTTTVTMTGGADVAVGLRWVKDNFALEGSLKETVLANGPYLIGGNAGQGLFANIGMALGF
jgi:hypothetical protein